MNRVLKEKELEYIDLPMFECPIGEKGKSAIGSYVNYLETGNLIIMPVFEVSGNRDAEAFNIMTETFPDRVIETVNINEIGIEGGLLNCISWTMELLDRIKRITLITENLTVFQQWQSSL